jgi:hypothetical protein
MIPTAQSFIPDDNYHFVEERPNQVITCIALEDIPKIMIDFAKLHVKAALESASRTERPPEWFGEEDSKPRHYDDKATIKNAYPETLIL